MSAKKGFSLSFRRFYLDQCLADTDFSGDVLDVGGKKENKRGTFRPPLERVRSWKYLNLDPSTEPDYLCSAEAIPVPAQSFDCVLMCEVLEHLREPERVLDEVSRVLRGGGRLILSIPFLFPFHADPEDYQRWTGVKIRLALEQAGYDNITVRPMGSVFAVIYDLLRYSAGPASKNKKGFLNRFFRKRVMPILKFVFIRLDNRYQYKNKYITTGYFVVAEKSMAAGIES